MAKFQPSINFIKWRISTYNLREILQIQEIWQEQAIHQADTQFLNNIKLPWIDIWRIILVPHKSHTTIQMTHFSRKAYLNIKYLPCIKALLRELSFPVNFDYYIRLQHYDKHFNLSTERRMQSSHNKAAELWTCKGEAAFSSLHDKIWSVYFI